MTCYTHTSKPHSNLGHSTNVTAWVLLGLHQVGFNLELLGVRCSNKDTPVVYSYSEHKLASVILTHPKLHFHLVHGTAPV